jgi:hypothetical protein
MNKWFYTVILVCSFLVTKSQNLIGNPSFEEFKGSCPSVYQNHLLSFSCDTITQGNTFCVLKDWMLVANYSRIFCKADNSSNGIPQNYCAKYVYPHTDSTCIGLFLFELDTLSPNSPNVRDVVQNKLKDTLIASHHYYFSMWVQLGDSIQWPTYDGKMAGISSFDAYFSAIPFSNWSLTHLSNFPILNYTPQVQINTMVTDTQHWVLLQDTFIAQGGEQYVTITNFKTDAQTKYEVVIDKDSLPPYAFYFIDDVSLIDLDDTASGINEQVAVGKLQVYPNPASNELICKCANMLINTVEVSNVVGQVCISIINYKSEIINVAALPSGIYFLKAKDVKGNVMNGKFVKE